MPQAIFSAILAALTHAVGTHEILFVLYFLTNIIDLFTGIAKAVYSKTYDSKIFCKGVFLKAGRWVVVLLAIILHWFFLEIGSLLSIDLNISKALVWFVLAALVFQDIRSIFENLTVVGVSIPPVLQNALLLAEKEMQQEFDGVMTVDSSDPAKDVYNLELSCPVEELKGKSTITFQVKNDESS